MGSVSSAMETENASSIFANFGLRLADGNDSLARGDGTAGLVYAVQARADREQRLQYSDHSVGTSATSTTQSDAASPTDRGNHRESEDPGK